MLVKHNGARYWRFAYRFNNKQETLAIGVYPDASLKEARLKRDEAHLAIALGNDPSELRKEQKLRTGITENNLFSHLAKRWWEHAKGTWSKDHAHRVWTRLCDNSFELLDRKPVNEIFPKDIRDVARSIESRDALDVASRVL